MNPIPRRYTLKDLEALAREKTREMSELAGGDFELAWPPGNPRKWEFKEWETIAFFVPITSTRCLS